MGDFKGPMWLSFMTKYDRIAKRIQRKNVSIDCLIAWPKLPSNLQTKQREGKYLKRICKKKKTNKQHDFRLNLKNAPVTASQTLHMIKSKPENPGTDRDRHNRTTK